MDALQKVVHYDICGALIFDEQSIDITIKPAAPQATKFSEDVRSSLLQAASSFTTESLEDKNINVFLIPPSEVFLAPSSTNDSYDNLISSFNIPFIVQNESVGILSISSCKESFLNDEDSQLIYTIVNQTSNALQRLRTAQTAEKSKMESMLESISEGVIMMDERYNVVAINYRAKQMLQIPTSRNISSEAITGQLKYFGIEKFAKSEQPAFIKTEGSLAFAPRQLN